MHRPTLIAAALASVSTAALASETITYSYDARGRLVRVVHSGTVNDGLSTTYTLDKADNRTSLTVNGASTAPSPSPTPTHAPVAIRAVVVPLSGFRVIPLPNNQ